MDQRKIGWIGGIAGAALGIFGALLGMLLWPSSPAENAVPPSSGAISILVWGVALFGAAVGVLGGVLGTYATLKNTKGPRERAFVVRASALCWVLILAFVVAIVRIPGWYNLIMFIPYVILLVFAGWWWNQAQMRIRREESGERAEPVAAEDRSGMW